MSAFGLIGLGLVLLILGLAGPAVMLGIAASVYVVVGVVLIVIGLVLYLVTRTRV